ncbi:hypothetical protein [Geodermatophilus sp. SYSU D00766]
MNVPPDAAAGGQHEPQVEGVAGLPDDVSPGSDGLVRVAIPSATGW